MNIFLEQTITSNCVLFLLAALGIWLAGSRLPLYADAISDRKRIGKAFIGLVFLAGVTSLPEIVAILSASVAGKPKLVLGALFGGIAMQTAVLALADAFMSPSPITCFPTNFPPRLRPQFLHFCSRSYWPSPRSATSSFFSI